MKLILLVSAAVVVAGGGAYLLREQPTADAATLAGDWRCNTKTASNADAFDGSILMTIDANCATRGQARFNSSMQGHTVIVQATFTGQTSLERGRLRETTTTAVITDATIDSQPLPAAVRTTLRDQLLA